MIPMMKNYSIINTTPLFFQTTKITCFIDRFIAVIQPDAETMDAPDDDGTRDAKYEAAAADRAIAGSACGSVLNKLVQNALESSSNSVDATRKM